MVSIDRDACIGCEACVNVCPEAFEMDDEGKAVFLGEAECIQDGIDSCPVGAITE